MRDLKEIKRLNNEIYINEKTSDILKDIKKNYGLTLDKNLKKIDFKAGYQVSVKDLFKVDFNIIYQSTFKYLLLDVLTYIEDLKDENIFIGLWIDNGFLYIDISTHIDNKDEALKIGKNFNQKAIYDFLNHDSIYLDEV